MLTDDDKQWIAERMEKSEERSAERLEKVETTIRTEFVERLEKVETTLLTEFHKWASPMELRQRSHAAAMRVYDAELEAISDRLKKLEGH
jgi:TRAP-type C4-dicarboxylate transport system substrate-binding protein